MSERSVGLVIAMSAEARAVTGRDQPTERVLRPSAHVFLRVGGVGAAAAERNCDALLEAGAEALISVGFAAGLSPRSVPGTLAVPEEVRSPGGEVFLSDPNWRTALLAALESGFDLLPGNIATVDTVIGSDDKRALHRSTGAVAADMESAAVAERARRAGLPMIALRVISDGPDDDLPPTLLRAVDRFGRARYASLIGGILRKPGDAAALLRLRKGFNKAFDTLSRLVAVTGPEFNFR